MKSIILLTYSNTCLTNDSFFITVYSYFLPNNDFFSFGSTNNNLSSSKENLFSAFFLLHRYLFQQLHTYP